LGGFIPLALYNLFILTISKLELIQKPFNLASFWPYSDPSGKFLAFSSQKHSFLLFAIFLSFGSKFS